MNAQSSIRLFVPLLLMAMLLLEPVPGHKIYYNYWNATEILLIDAKFKNCCEIIRKLEPYSYCQKCLDDGANTTTNKTDISGKSTWNGTRHCRNHMGNKIPCQQNNQKSVK